MCYIIELLLLQPKIYRPNLGVEHGLKLDGTFCLAGKTFLYWAIFLVFLPAYLTFFQKWPEPFWEAKKRSGCKSRRSS
jgi:hypothetical protein